MKSRLSITLSLLACLSLQTGCYLFMQEGRESLPANRNDAGPPAVESPDAFRTQPTVGKARFERPIDPDAIQAQIEILAVGESYEVDQAHVVLLLMGADAVPALLEALKNGAPQLRKNTIPALANISSDVIDPALVESLQDENQEVALAVLGALTYRGSRMGVDAVSEVVLTHPEEAMRIEAARQLFVTQSQRVVPPLIKALEDPNRYVRLEAISGLGHLKDARALVPLSQQLKDPDTEIVTGALRALSYLSTALGLNIKSQVKAGFKTEAQLLLNQLLKALSDPRVEVKKSALQVLAQFDAPEIVLASKALRQDPQPELRAEALTALASQRGEAAETVLIQGLQDAHEDVRAAAIAAIARGEFPRAWKHIGALLQEPSGRVREEAVQALTWLKEPSAFGPLLGLLADEELAYDVDPESVLIRMADRSALESYSLAQRSQDSEIRAFARRELARLQSPFFEQALAEAVQSKNPAMIQEILKIYRLSQRPASAELLRSLLSHPNPQLREAAVLQIQWFSKSYDSAALLDAMLSRLNEVRSAERDEEEHMVGSYLARSLVDLARDVPAHRPKIEAAMIEILKSGDDHLHLFAVEALGEIPSPRARATLKAALKDVDSPFAQMSVATQLLKAGDEQAWPVLQRLLKDDDLREPVIDALGELAYAPALPVLKEYLHKASERDELAIISALRKIGGPDSAEFLLSLLQSPHRERRLAAVEALGKLEDASVIPPSAVPQLVEALLALNKRQQQGAQEALQTLETGDYDEYFREIGASIEFSLESALLSAIKSLDPDGATPALRQLLRSDTLEDQIFAAEALAELPSPQAVPDLLALAGTENEALRDAVFKALGQSGAPRALSLLLEALAQTPAQRRAEMYPYLVGFSRPEVIPILVEVLQSESSLYSTEAEAMKALIQAHDPQVIPFLIPLLQLDSSYQEMEFVLQGLTKLVLRHPQAKEALAARRALKSKLKRQNSEPVNALLLRALLKMEGLQHR